MSRLLGYVRVSTAEQAEHGFSLGAQRERLASYCVAYGHELIDVHASEGVSGSVPIARRLATIIERLEAGEADGLIFAKLDRLSRSTHDFLAFVELVEKREWLLVSVGDHLDTSSATGRFSLTILVALAQLERERTGERIREIHESKRARGERIGPVPPFGFKHVRDGKVMRVLPNTSEAATIAEARKLRAAGISLRTIGKALSQAGMYPRSGRLTAWHPKTVAALLSQNATPRAQAV